MLEHKTQLNGMVSGRPTASAPTPGKSTLANLDGAEHGEEKKEGGEGKAAPTGGANGAKGAPSSGLTVQTKRTAAGAPNNRTTIGLGEEIGVSATSYGAWKVNGAEFGKGQALQRPSFAAPGWVGETLGDHTITHTPDDPGDGKKTATTSTVTIKVIAPNAVSFKKLGELPMAGPGEAGVGMRTRVTVGPLDVSFGALGWRELPSGAAHSGYFDTYVAQGKNNSIDHHPAEAPIPMGDTNDGIIDAAFSKSKPKLMNPTTKSMGWWQGDYSWAIPNVYSYKGTETPFTTINQAFSINDQGVMTVQKQSEKASAHPGGQIDGEIETFKSVPEAVGMLSQHKSGCIVAAINYCSNPKADPESVKNIIAGLKASNIKLAITLKCNNKWSWSDPDLAKSLTASGKGGPVAATAAGSSSFNTGDARKFVVAKIGDLIDLDKMTTGQAISIKAVIHGWKDHDLSFKLAYPYEVSDQPLEGTDRYTVSANVQVGD